MTRVRRAHSFVLDITDGQRAAVEKTADGAPSALAAWRRARRIGKVAPGAAWRRARRIGKVAPGAAWRRARRIEAGDCAGVGAVRGRQQSCQVAGTPISGRSRTLELVCPRTLSLGETGPIGKRRARLLSVGAVCPLAVWCVRPSMAASSTERGPRPCRVLPPTASPAPSAIRAPRALGFPSRWTIISLAAIAAPLIVAFWLAP